MTRVVARKTVVFQSVAKDLYKGAWQKKSHRLGWDEQIAVLPVALPERNHVKIS